jgi:O-antigen/teichoic acid export membrane protein
VTGILYFLADFFLDFIFGDVYVIYNVILKLYIFTTIFKFFDPIFQSLIGSLNKVKYITKLRIVHVCYSLPLFFFGLIFFGLTGALVGSIIGFFIRFVLEIIISIKIGNIRLKMKTVLLQYLLFFISLGFVIVLDVLVLKNLSQTILLKLKLTILKNFNFLSILMYIFTFFILNFLFKIFSANEVDQIKQLFNEEGRFQKLIRKGLSFSKKIIEMRSKD